MPHPRGTHILDQENPLVILETTCNTGFFLTTPEDEYGHNF